MYQKNIYKVEEQIVQVDLGTHQLEGELVIPYQAEGIVVFAHGSGNSRYSTRNRYLAHILRQAGLATLLIDLLTKEEEILEQRTNHFYGGTVTHFAMRLGQVTEWLQKHPLTENFSVGYLGDRIGAAAALIAATQNPNQVKAVVCRAGKTDLAGTTLASVMTPTLLIVGSEDLPTLSANQQAMALIPATNKQLEIIKGASQNFDEPSMSLEVARLASSWFQQYLTSSHNKEFHLYAMSLF